MLAYFRQQTFHETWQLWPWFRSIEMAHSPIRPLLDYKFSWISVAPIVLFIGWNVSMQIMSSNRIWGSDKHDLNITAIWPIHFGHFITWMFARAVFSFILMAFRAFTTVQKEVRVSDSVHLYFAYATLCYCVNFAVTSSFRRASAKCFYWCVFCNALSRASGSATLFYNMK